MEDPKRILDGSAINEVDSLSRDLLSSLSPTRDEQDRLLGKVLRHVGVAAALGTAAATVSTKAGASGAAHAALAVPSTLGKWLLPLLALVPVGVGVGYLARGTLNEAPQSEGAERSVLAPTSPPSETPEPPSTEEKVSLPQINDAPPSPQADPATPRTQPSQPGSAPQKESALREEDRLVRIAREQWKSGQAEAALKTLAELSRKFPYGVLLREREMLRTSISKELSSADSPGHPSRGSK